MRREFHAMTVRFMWLLLSVKKMRARHPPAAASSASGKGDSREG
jgi:hypothetical protein